MCLAGELMFHRAKELASWGRCDNRLVLPGPWTSISGCQTSLCSEAMGCEIVLHEVRPALRLPGLTLRATDRISSNTSINNLPASH